MFNIEGFKIPKSVKINRKITYKVSLIDSFEDPRQIGECDYDKRLISIKNDLDNVTTFWVFFHELQHALSEENNLNMTERQVNGIEVGLSKIAKLNGWAGQSHCGKCLR